jgi:hypothetical protein
LLSFYEFGALGPGDTGDGRVLQEVGGKRVKLLAFFLLDGFPSALDLFGYRQRLAAEKFTLALNLAQAIGRQLVPGWVPPG